MKTILQSLSRNARQCVLIGIYMLLSFSIWAQTTPAISFTTTFGGNFSFGIKAAAANTAIKIDWGDGKQVGYTVGTNTATITSPKALSGTTNVSVYGSDINYLYLVAINLTKIDVSNCPKLENLDLFSNSIKTLDVSKNTNLLTLNCGNNGLTALNVTKNTLLTSLICHINQISSLDVTKNTALVWFACGSNNLTALDVTKNTLLTNLYCSYNQIRILDVSKNTALKVLDCSNNYLNFGTLPAPNSRYTSYIYAPQGVTNVDSPALDNIEDLSDQLTVVDKNGQSQTTTYVWKQAGTAMKAGTDYMVLSPGKFQFLKVPNLLFYCEMANPAFPDLSGRDAKKFAYLMNPAITLTPGSLDEFEFGADAAIDYNPVIVDYGEGGFYYNPTAPLPGYYNSYTIPARSSIYPVKIYGSGINLLYVPSAGLSSVDVKNCTTLTRLYCYGNNLTALDVSKNTALDYLNCGANKISALDVSKNTRLTEFSCYGNKLTGIDVSKNTALINLSVRTNQISNLDVSKNTQLVELYCRDNKLTALDLTKNTKITDLNCYGNAFTFASLPQVQKQYTAYEYAPQADFFIPKSVEKGQFIDLSSQLQATDVNLNTQNTVYKWKTTAGSALVQGIDYAVSEAGKFTFLTIPSDSVYCEMSNAAFPNFTGTKTYKTTLAKIALSTGIDDQLAGGGIFIYAKGQTVYVSFADVPANARVAVYDTTGRLVASKVADDLLTKIPISKRGLYMVRVQEGNKYNVKKVLISE